VLYGAGGTVVQVVRRARVETKRVEVGLMSGGQVEIREGLVEGDIVVARAGALLREGDPVRPVTVSAEGKLGSSRVGDLARQVRFTSPIGEVEFERRRGNSGEGLRSIDRP